MPRKPRTASKATPKTIPITKDENFPRAITLWGPEGVEVVGLEGRRPAGRCRFGGEAPSFQGEEILTRAMLEAALVAVRNGALGEVPADRSVRLPQ